MWPGPWLRICLLCCFVYCWGWRDWVIGVLSYLAGWVKAGNRRQGDRTLYWRARGNGLGLYFCEAGPFKDSELGLGDLDGRVEQAFLVGLALRSQTGGWDGAWSGLCEVGPDGLGGVGVGAAEEWETGHWICNVRAFGKWIFIYVSFLQIYNV